MALFALGSAPGGLQGSTIGGASHVFSALLSSVLLFRSRNKFLWQKRWDFEIKGLVLLGFSNLDASLLTSHGAVCAGVSPGWIAGGA